MIKVNQGRLEYFKTSPSFDYDENNLSYNLDSTINILKQIIDTIIGSIKNDSSELEDSMNRIIKEDVSEYDKLPELKIS